MKKIIKFLLIITALFPFKIFALTFPEYSFKNAIVYDYKDNIILYELNSKEKTSIASLTKIATVITAIEEIDNLDEKVTITYDILSTVDPEASTAGLKVGDKVTYRDLLYASMLPSGADASNAIAILSNGSVEKFVEKMNLLAKRIGLSNTHYSNVTGLEDNNHYSTAEDVNKLLAYSLQNKDFKEIYTQKKYTLSNGLEVVSTLYRYNQNNGIDISQILGSKTGFTDEAGYCMSSLANVQGHEILITVLNDKASYQLKDTADIIDFINKNYKEQILIKKGTKIAEVPVILSKIKLYDILTSKDIKRLLPNDYDRNILKASYRGLDTLSYKIAEGKKIGSISYYYEDNLYGNEDVLVSKINPTFIEKAKNFINKNIIIKIISIVLLIFITLCILLGLLIIALIIRKKIRRYKRKRRRRKK